MYIDYISIDYSSKKFDYKYSQSTNGLWQINGEEDKVRCKAQAKRKKRQRNCVRDES